jgi:hypothetical protein
MKKLLILSLLLPLLALLAARPATGTFRLDPAASTLAWTGHAEAGSWAPQGSIRLREGTWPNTCAGPIFSMPRSSPPPCSS